MRRGGGKDRREGSLGGEEPGKQAALRGSELWPASLSWLFRRHQEKKKCHLQTQRSHPEKLSCSRRAKQTACELGVHREAGGG